MKKAPDLSLIYSDILDKVEKDFHLSPANNNDDVYSTGVLTIDLVIGGGLRTGANFIISGMEQSAKSTLAMHTLGSFLNYNVPIINYYDPENSVDTRYTSSILRVPNLSSVFGLRDGEGKWVKKPLVRHYQDNVLEVTFDSIIKILNTLPDKRFRREDGKYYHVIDVKDKRQAGFLNALRAQQESDKKLSDSQYVWFRAEQSGPQCLAIIDSYAALVAGTEEEKETASNAMALEARLFSKMLRRIVGKTKRKAVIIFGTNQLREKPGVMYGSPIIETGGNALKFYSTIRNRIAARAVPDKWRSPKSSQISFEPSVEGNGMDKYAYKFFSNIKNKYATPYLECWTRVWIKDCNGQGRGFDPVFDFAEFMQMINLMTVSGAPMDKKVKFSPNLPKPFSPFSDQAWKWGDLKLVVLAGEKNASEELRNRALEFLRQRNLPAMSFRNAAKKLLADKTATKLFSVI